MEGLEDVTEKFCGKRLRTRIPLNCAQQHLRRDHITATCSHGIFCLSLPFLFFGAGLGCVCAAVTRTEAHMGTHIHTAHAYRGTWDCWRQKLNPTSKQRAIGAALFKGTSFLPGKDRLSLWLRDFNKREKREGMKEGRREKWEFSFILFLPFGHPNKVLVWWKKDPNLK